MNYNERQLLIERYGSKSRPCGCGLADGASHHPDCPHHEANQSQPDIPDWQAEDDYFAEMEHDRERFSEASPI